MTAEEIRKYAADDRNLHDVGGRIILAEIAAQLAELNQQLANLSEGDGGYLSVITHEP